MSTSIQLLAPAKINLFLELMKRRHDGYHELETVMVTLGIFDHLVFRKRPDFEIRIQNFSAGQVNSRIPVGPQNLVWKAIECLRNESGTMMGVEVMIHKSIPMQSGLGGGSSDAAATFHGINRLFRLGLSRHKLVELANRIGSDIAFFFSAPAALCRGRGEIVRPLKTSLRDWFVVAMPPQGLSTAEVFRNSQVPQRPHSSQRIVAALADDHHRNLGKLLFNRLQAPAEQLNPWIQRMRCAFAVTGAAGHQMSGSGSSYFGRYRSRRRAQNAQRLIRARLPDVATYCARGLGISTCLAQGRDQ